MKKVYVVIEGCYSDQSIEGVFSTKEKALEAFEGDEKRMKETAYTIREIDFDQSLRGGNRFRKCYEARIALKETPVKYNLRFERSLTQSGDTVLAAGTVYKEYQSFAWGHSGESGHHSLKDEAIFKKHWDFAYSVSFESPEHARKLAVEAYQKYLALKAGVV